MEKVRRQIDPWLCAHPRAASTKRDRPRLERALVWRSYSAADEPGVAPCLPVHVQPAEQRCRLRAGAVVPAAGKSVDVSGSWQLDLVIPPWPRVWLPPEFPDTLAVASRRLIAPRPSWALPLTPHFSADTLDSSPIGGCTEVEALCGQRLATLKRPQCVPRRDCGAFLCTLI